MGAKIVLGGRSTPLNNANPSSLLFFATGLLAVAASPWVELTTASEPSFSALAFGAE